MRGIVEKIIKSRVPVIVGRPERFAGASAGFFILESADIAAMAPARTPAPHIRSRSAARRWTTSEDEAAGRRAAFMRSIARGAGA
jgi:membrane-bound ClpP family serine protease